MKDAEDHGRCRWDDPHRDAHLDRDFYRYDMSDDELCDDDDKEK